jgi:hypothetical protein
MPYPSGRPVAEPFPASTGAGSPQHNQRKGPT